MKWLLTTFILLNGCSFVSDSFSEFCANEQKTQEVCFHVGHRFPVNLSGAIPVMPEGELPPPF